MINQLFGKNGKIGNENDAITHSSMVQLMDDKMHSCVYFFVGIYIYFVLCSYLANVWMHDIEWFNHELLTVC